jgi:hypothetical protein
MGRIFFGLVHNPFSAGLNKAADPQINLWTLRRLARKPGRQATCAENLRSRIGQGQLSAAKLFQFPLPVVRQAVEKAAVEPLAEIAAKIEEGIALPLSKMKRCNFEPLHAGVAQWLYLYYSVPKEHQEQILRRAKEVSPILYELVNTALSNNVLITKSANTEDILRRLGDIMIWFHLAKK